MKIEVKKLPEVPNICNQSLREAWKSNDFSLAYVEADHPSFLHKHPFLELYYILRGRGIMQLGEEQITVKENDLIEIGPGVPHKLINITLVVTHLVIASPPFNSDGVEIIDEK